MKKPCNKCEMTKDPEYYAWCCCPAFTKWNNRRLEKEKKYCCGKRSSGSWKNYRCGAVGKYKYDGKFYCANHYPPTLALKNKNEVV